MQRSGRIRELTHRESAYPNVACSRCCSPSFRADEVKVRADIQKIDQYRDHVPCDYGPRNNQQTVVDPQDLKDAHDGRHPRVNASAGATPEHGNQVGRGGEGRSKTRQKTEDF